MSFLKPFAFSLSFLFCLNGHANSLDYPSHFKCDGGAKFNWYCDEEKKVEAPQQQIVIPIVAEEPKKEEVKPKVIMDPVPLKEEPAKPLAIEPPVLIKSEPLKTQREIDLENFNALKKELEDLRNIFYINPTNENADNYIKKQNEITHKASVMTEVWQRRLWANPELDYNTKFPVATDAKYIYLEEVEKEKHATIKKLKDDGWGLFFFYSSQCSYCHLMAESIKFLEKRTNMNILSISIDGNFIDGLPNNKVDNGQAKELGITETPTTILVNTKTREIISVGKGFVSTESLFDRIYKIVAKEPGTSH